MMTLRSKETLRMQVRQKLISGGRTRVMKRKHRMVTKAKLMEISMTMRSKQRRKNRRGASGQTTSSFKLQPMPYQRRMTTSMIARSGQAIGSSNNRLSRKIKVPRAVSLGVLWPPLLLQQSLASVWLASSAANSTKTSKESELARKRIN